MPRSSRHSVKLLSRQSLTGNRKEQADLPQEFTSTGRFGTSTHQGSSYSNIRMLIWLYAGISVHYLNVEKWLVSFATVNVIQGSAKVRTISREVLFE